METIDWNHFEKIELRIGTIIEVAPFPKARNPAFKLKIDFGELGIKRSSAQITNLYNPEDLLGRQVMAILNFPPKQIADMMSECLVMGAIGDERGVILMNPDLKVKNGSKVA